MSKVSNKRKTYLNSKTIENIKQSFADIENGRIYTLKEITEKLGL